MATIKATIFFDKRYWVGTFERTDKEGYAVARHIFGGEPSDPEVYEFVLTHYLELKFGEPKRFTLEIKRMNPKRVQREVRREMERIKETSKPSTFAQDYTEVSSRIGFLAGLKAAANRLKKRGMYCLILPSFF